MRISGLYLRHRRLRSASTLLPSRLRREWHRRILAEHRVRFSIAPLEIVTGGKGQDAIGDRPTSAASSSRFTRVNLSGRDAAADVSRGRNES